VIVAPLLAAAALAAATPAAKPQSATLLAAGDIASCGSRADEQTAALLEGRRGTIAALGDLLYDGSYDECYAWRGVKQRTRPALGNHDYEDRGAAYFAYWGARFGRDPQHGWYSYDLGRWHVVVLNSNCAVVSCAAGSEQERWLRADLREHRRLCTLAYWHHPRFSSGRHGSHEATAPLWVALQAARAEVVLVGHDHDYERFAPQTDAGVRDAGRGVREFVVGTGGKSMYEFTKAPLPNSLVRADVYGVLELTLLAKSYRWRFLPVEGSSFADRGSGRCR
jgi:hypothetical protein